MMNSRCVLAAYRAGSSKESGCSMRAASLRRSGCYCAFIGMSAFDPKRIGIEAA
jgi:hypothetical protein